MLTREQIVAALRMRLEPLDYVYSFFEAGSVSFGADDELSDLDLVSDAAEGRAADVFVQVETALNSLAPFDYIWEVPEPAWHGYSQRFYHLAGTPEFLYIDYLVRADGQPLRLTEVEHHGEPRVYFDKLGLTAPTRLDREEVRRNIAARLAAIRGSLPLLAAFTRKELQRGNAADAMSYYHSGVLRPLVELLRIQCCPLRYSFGLRYLRRDVGDEHAQRVARLCYAGSPEELGDRVAEAERWFRELIGAVDLEKLEL